MIVSRVDSSKRVSRQRRHLPASDAQNLLEHELFQSFPLFLDLREAGASQGVVRVRRERQARKAGAKGLKVSDTKGVGLAQNMQGRRVVRGTKAPKHKAPKLGPHHHGSFSV